MNINIIYHPPTIIILSIALAGYQTELVYNRESSAHNMSSTVVGNKSATEAASSSRDTDLEANHRDADGYETRSPTRYQSTILPASAIDFDPEPHKRLFRQFGNPAPLGLSAFALSVFVLSLINVHARSVTVPNILIGLGASHEWQ
jgi:hypothetical protein